MSSELRIRSLFAMPTLDIPPLKRIQLLGAFFPHWNLHKRLCDKTGRDIISVFRSDCPYPVWHKDEWFKNANPPKAVFDFNKLFFPQAETLFKQCPIPHNSGATNENCEYTDDWWQSKNCYLSHTGLGCEDSRYLYRTIRCKNSCYAVFSAECEQSIDVIHCEKCFAVVHGLYLKNCQHCFFCYDCRNCSECLFSCNIRNKRYCIANKQLSKEQYELQKSQFDFSTLEGYQRNQHLFTKMMQEIAWHRSQYQDLCENSKGNYLGSTNNVACAFFCNPAVEDGYNIVRGGWSKTLLDVVNFQDVERVYLSSGIQIKSYDVRCSFQLTEARFIDYSAYSAQIENCFGCCGLVRAKNCILNKVYSTQEYSTLKDRIIDHMKSTGEWGQFFPGSFAPNPYDESWSSFYFPLSESGQKEQGYFFLPNPEKHNEHYYSSEEIPACSTATLETTKNTYWDEVAQRPFQILAQDINFCRDLGVPLPSTYYMRRIQENFRWMPYDGTLRTTTCAKSGKEIQTSWPNEYDGRILSEEEYLRIVN